MNFLILLVGLIPLVISAPVNERIIAPFSQQTSSSDVSQNAASSASASADGGQSSASASASADSSPVILTGAGKKIQISITKEVGQHMAAQQGTVHAHATANAGQGNSAHPTHKPHQAATQRPATLHIDNNAIVVDNQTIATMLQQLLAGNIQNAQTHGHPLALPASGKPVAVIYSAAMHVVDLGTLKPAATAAPAQHNHTTHAAINHTSILQSLMAPLMSLTHIGTHATVAAPTPIVAAPVQQMQMQPVVVMMPMAQAAAPQMTAASQFDASAQLNGVLQGLLSAKQQMMAASAVAHEPHAAPAPAVQTADASANSIAQAPQIIKTKQVDINVSKQVIV